MNDVHSQEGQIGRPQPLCAGLIRNASCVSEHSLGACLDLIIGSFLVYPELHSRTFGGAKIDARQLLYTFYAWGFNVSAS